MTPWAFVIPGKPEVKPGEAGDSFFEEKLHFT